MHDPIARLNEIPRIPIALLPTPVLELARLRAALGEGCPRVFIKRDDLTGLALGGNKSRKLEYLLADAVSKSATSVITCGAAQSNHALQTAAACKIFGFDVRCILYGRPPDEGAGRSGNLLLHELLDTPIRWVTMRVGETRREQALRRGMAEEAAKVEAEGGRVYWIPTGGSTAVGALGYARAVIELRTQIPEAEIDKIKAIYFASGSGGTHTGLVVGKWLANWDVRCVGAEVEPIQAGSDGVSPFRRAIQNLTRETASLLGIDRPVMPDDIELDGSCTGRAYGVETEEGREAARLLFRTEGILLDPVYTAKTFASMVAAIRRGDFSADQIVLFWHTGGAAGLFAAH